VRHFEDFFEEVLGHVMQIGGSVRSVLEQFWIACFLRLEHSSQYNLHHKRDVSIKTVLIYF
jgi:hypothetical protein